MQILVTGASGFLGSHLIEELSKQEDITLRAVLSKQHQQNTLPSDFLIAGLDIEVLATDWQNPQEINEWAEGCEIVFHCESYVSFDRKAKDLMNQIHVTGTQYLLEACHKNKVQKFVYTSGMELLRPPVADGVGNEENGVSQEDLLTPFAKIRSAGENLVLQYWRKRNLPVVITHPTVLVGPKDEEITLFGQYLLKLLKLESKFLIETGLNLIDVRDAAKGHLLAAKLAKPGSRFILGNKNVYLSELVSKVEELSGVPCPRTILPYWMAQWGNRLSRRFPPGLIQQLKRPLFFDANKAVTELKMPQNDVWKALRQEIEYFKRKGLGP